MSDDLLAFRDALGVLEESARREVAARRLTDPAFDGRVVAWEERMMQLSLIVAPAVAPSPELWDRIDAALDAEDPRGTRLPRRGDSPWMRWGDGVEARALDRAADARPESLLLRLAPGAAPRRADGADADGRAQVWMVIEGALRFDGRLLNAGDQAYSRPGSDLWPVAGNAGALIYLRYLPDPKA